MNLFRWLFGDSSLGVIDHWTPERAAKAEREMHVRMGRVSEPSYTWHPKLLASYQRQQRRKTEQTATVVTLRRRA